MSLDYMKSMLECEDPEVTLVERKRSDPILPDWRPVFQPVPKVSFVGPYGKHNVGKSNIAWWGNNYVVSSLFDTKHIFGWDVRTGEISFTLGCRLVEYFANVEPHPFYPVRQFIQFDFISKKLVNLLKC